MEVLCLGQPGIYEKQGRLQFTVFTMEPRGLGALHAELEARIAKLRREGLTDPARKRALPAVPRRVGVVTSRDGAALHDVLRTVWRRDPRAHVRLAPTVVQGAQAHHHIVRALRRLDRSGCDVILLVRGGGSLEDLWSFNQEAVARAVVQCRAPVVTGVGHETDTTLADLVADRRASTPTAAAEAAVPVRAAVVDHLNAVATRLWRTMEGRLGRERARWSLLERRLPSPQRTLHQRRLQVHHALQRTADVAARTVRQSQQRLRSAEKRLAPHDPSLRIAQLQQRLQRAQQRLEHALSQHHARRRHRLAALAGRLEALSPLAVLSRGYGLVQTADGTVVRRARQVRPGDALRIRLAEGTVQTTVEAIEDDPS
jgi:exodeoxyribonuclease VII large subunit